MNNPSLPTGTVTFLFTDIEGSTKLAREYPDAILALLARHHEILNQSIQAHNGYVFQVVGDSFAVAFHNANDALNAALQAQRLLHNESWSPAPIKVRMGIHTGAAQFNDASAPIVYSGYATIASTQRIMSAGHGGQVLISGATRELVRDVLPENAELLDIGEKRLKDLLRPEHIYQLNIADLPATFPPLKTLDAFLNNLPTQLTSFIGRENEIAEVKQELESHRLVTLTGSGGTGKTRLSLQVATDLLEEFDHGVWFVELAPLTDPELISQTLISAIGLSEQAGKPPLELLKEYLHDKKSLIVLDNCEHLIEASAKVANALLNAAPGIKIMASSREALGVKGELSYPVPSLSLPDMKDLPVIEQLSQYEAVRLFIDRALLVAPHFAVNKDNAPFVAQICYRLDGIPLAIELAAVRIKHFSPEQIAARLDDRFHLLTGGGRTTTLRQQTLRAAIDWSYSLLSEPERILFRRLSVFAGGWTFEAAEQVCAGDGLETIEVLDSLTHVLDKSLVTTDARSEGTRYRMLETIREYAHEKLRQAGENARLLERHFDFYRMLANETITCPPDQEPALFNRLEREHDNLRAALNWTLEQDESERALELCEALAQFWENRGYWTESSTWFDRILGASRRAQANASMSQKHQILFAKVLRREGFRALEQGDYSLADARLNEGLGIFQELGDKSGIGDVFFSLGVLAWYQGNAETGQSFFEQYIAINRELDDKPRIAHALWALGLVAMYRGDYSTARTLSEKSLQNLRAMGEMVIIPWVLDVLGCLAMIERDFKKSEALFQESLVLHEKSRNPLMLAVWFVNKGFLAWYEGDYPAACHLLRKGLELFRTLKMSSFNVSRCLAGLAVVDTLQGNLARATRLLGAIRAENDRTGSRLTDFCLDAYDKALASARSQLDEETFAKEWAEGRALTMAQAIQLALSDER